MTISALKADPLLESTFGSITSSFTAVGSPIPNSWSIITFKNLTNVSLIISWDGVDDNMKLPANSFEVLDLTSNEGVIVRTTQFFVKHGVTPPSTNSMVIQGYFI